MSKPRAPRSPQTIVNARSRLYGSMISHFLGMAGFGELGLQPDHSPQSARMGEGKTALGYSVDPERGLTDGSSPDVGEAGQPNWQHCHTVGALCFKLQLRICGSNPSNPTPFQGRPGLVREQRRQRERHHQRCEGGLSGDAQPRNRRQVTVTRVPRGTRG